MVNSVVILQKQNPEMTFLKKIQIHQKYITNTLKIVLENASGWRTRT